MGSVNGMKIQQRGKSRIFKCVVFWELQPPVWLLVDNFICKSVVQRERQGWKSKSLWSYVQTHIAHMCKRIWSLSIKRMIFVGDFFCNQSHMLTFSDTPFFSLSNSTKTMKVRLQRPAMPLSLSLSVFHSLPHILSLFPTPLLDSPVPSPLPSFNFFLYVAQ